MDKSTEQLIADMKQRVEDEKTAASEREANLQAAIKNQRAAREKIDAEWARIKHLVAVAVADVNTGLLRLAKLTFERMQNVNSSTGYETWRLGIVSEPNAAIKKAFEARFLIQRDGKLQITFQAVSVMNVDEQKSYDLADFADPEVTATINKVLELSMKG